MTREAAGVRRCRSLFFCTIKSHFNGDKSWDEKGWTGMKAPNVDDSRRSGQARSAGRAAKPCAFWEGRSRKHTRVFPASPLPEPWPKRQAWPAFIPVDPTSPAECFSLTTEPGWRGPETPTKAALWPPSSLRTSASVVVLERIRTSQESAPNEKNLPRSPGAGMSRIGPDPYWLRPFECSSTMR